VLAGPAMSACKLRQIVGSYECMIARICSPVAAVHRLSLKLVSQRMRSAKLSGEIQNILKKRRVEQELQKVLFSFSFYLARTERSVVSDSCHSEDRMNHSN
jgi:hypothetical protein